MADALALAEVEAVGAGLKIQTCSGTATVSLAAEAGAVVLVVTAPRLGEDWRLPMWAAEHLEQQIARVRAEAESLRHAIADQAFADREGPITDGSDVTRLCGVCRRGEV